MNQISPRARLGKDVEVGPFTIIHDDVEIGDRSTIASHCVLGVPKPVEGEPALVIGADSVIRSHAVFYQGSRFGDRLETGHHVTVRENTVGGRNLRIGTHGDIQGHCRLGDFVRLHSDVHVSQGSQIGDLVWIFPGVRFTNDPLPPSQVQVGVRIGDMAVVAASVLLLPGIEIGLGSFVAAGSIVQADVPPVVFAGGQPARVLGPLDRLINLEHGLRFPWTSRFRGRYPDDAQALIDAVHARVEAALGDARQRRRAAREAPS